MPAIAAAPQNVTIDLGAPHEVFAILFWHFHKTPRVYFDVVVQVADDAGFSKNVRTLFNNDHDNTSKLGAGTDMNYVETAEGKLVDAKEGEGFIQLKTEVTVEVEGKNKPACVAETLSRVYF